MRLRNQAIMVVVLFFVVSVLSSLPIGSIVASKELPLVDDFSDGDISSNPQWITNSPFFIENKMLVGSGTALAPSMHAYGTWEFAFYPPDEAKENRWLLWLVREGNVGYYITLVTGSFGYRLALEKMSGVARHTSTIITPAPVLFSSKKLAHVRVTRNSEGIFTLYVNGQYYGKGKDNEITASTSLGFTGNNLKIKEIRASPDVVTP